MTKRALIIGLFIAALIAGLTHINDNVIRQAGLVENFMPISVYGLLVLLLIAINPLLLKIKPSMALKGNECAVILAIALVACSVPSSGLMRFFPNIMMRPHQWAKTKPSWQKESVLQKVPGFMIAGRAPAFTPDDFKDAPALCKDISGDDKQDVLPLDHARIREMIPDDYKQAILATATSGNHVQAANAMTVGLNAVLVNPDLFTASAFPDFNLPPEAKQILLHAGSEDPVGDLKSGTVGHRLSADHVRQEHVMVFNRHLIDSVWPTAIHSRSAQSNDDLGGYLMGQGDLNKPVAFSDVPWAAWIRPLAFWIPVVLIMAVGVISLSLIIHTQWSHNEKLPYPLVQFTEALLPDNTGKVPELFHKPSFWWAGGITFGIFMLNYANLQFPDNIPALSLDLDFSALQDAFNFKNPGLARWMLLTVRVIPITIGIAYLVRSDVSLSVGISIPVWYAVPGLFTLFGISLNESKIAGGGLYSCRPVQLLVAGAALGFALQILYYGRAYYLNVLKRACFVKTESTDAPQVAVVAARFFTVCTLLISLYLICVGVDWFLAITYTLLAFTLFLVMARVVAETGIFFYMAGWYPCVTIIGLLGINAIGPGVALILLLFSTVLLVRPREALMPFVVGALKVLDDQNVKPKSMAPWLMASIVLAVLIAVPVSLKYIHGTGAPTHDGWALAVSRYSFQKAVHMTKQLKATERYEDVKNTSGLARLARIEPDVKTVTFFICGALIVMGLSYMRLRWRWWPLHPVIILVFSVQTTVGIWHSFLIGWVIRLLVVRFGGHRAYSKITPIMIGLIAGNILGLLIPNIIGAIYYFVSGGERLVSPPIF